jgi:hypothetical protein
MLTTAANVAALIIMMHLVLIIVLALAIGAVSLKAMLVLNSKLRTVMPQIQGYSRLLSRKTDDVSQRVASPFFSYEAKKANAAAMRSHVTRPVARRLERAGLMNETPLEK